MKRAVRIIAAVVAAAIAAFLALSAVMLTAGWAGADVTAIRIHFIVGAVVIGLAVGAASAWFAPSTMVSAVVTCILLGLLYLPYNSMASPDWLAQLAAALLGAAAPTVWLAKVRGVDR